MMNSANAMPLYAEAFGFTERPFTLVPDASVIYWSDPHKWAYSVLEYGVRSGAPITLLTGEIGAGKTTLVRELLEQLCHDYSFILISNAHGDRCDLLAWMLAGLGVPQPPRDRLGPAREVALHLEVERALVAEYAAGRRVVVIVDEAQNLSVEALEEVRLLTNMNSGRDEVVQVVLVGQPELRDKVCLPELKQLAQRVVANYHLDPMDEQTVPAYVAHRLRLAGGTGVEFTPDAARLVHVASRGIPRLVNQLCDFALLYAWSAEMLEVDEEIVNIVLAEGVFFDGGVPQRVVDHAAIAASASLPAPVPEAVA